MAESKFKEIQNAYEKIRSIQIFEEIIGDISKEESEEQEFEREK